MVMTMMLAWVRRDVCSSEGKISVVCLMNSRFKSFLDLTSLAYPRETYSKRVQGGKAAA